MRKKNEVSPVVFIQNLFWIVFGLFHILAANRSRPCLVSYATPGGPKWRGRFVSSRGVIRRLCAPQQRGCCLAVHLQERHSSSKRGRHLLSLSSPLFFLRFSSFSFSPFSSKRSFYKLMGYFCIYFYYGILTGPVGYVNTWISFGRRTFYWSHN